MAEQLQQESGYGACSLKRQNSSSIDESTSLIVKENQNPQVSSVKIFTVANYYSLEAYSGSISQKLLLGEHVVCLLLAIFTMQFCP